MSFAISTDGIKTINTRGDAALLFNGTPAVKSDYWASNERPLRKRAEQSKKLVRYGDRYVARLYKTDMVTYHADDTVSITRHDSRSSVEFVDAVAPYGLSVCSHHGAMWIRVLEEPGVVRYYQPKEYEQLHFKRVYSGQWTLLNPDSCLRHSVHHVNKDASKEVRAKLKPLAQYISAVMAISQNDMTAIATDAENQLRHGSLEYKQKLRLALTGELETHEYPKFITAHCLRVFDTRRHGHVGRSLTSDWKQKLTYDAYYVAAVFDRIDIPLGELPPKDRWKQ